MRMLRVALASTRPDGLLVVVIFPVVLFFVVLKFGAAGRRGAGIFVAILHFPYLALTVTGGGGRPCRSLCFLIILQVPGRLFGCVVFRSVVVSDVRR